MKIMVHLITMRNEPTMKQTVLGNKRACLLRMVGVRIRHTTTNVEI